MKTDLYSKIVLTTIAVMLVVIVFQNAEILPQANASKTGNGFATSRSRPSS